MTVASVIASKNHLKNKLENVTLKIV